MIKEKIENLKSGRLTPTENIRQFLDKIKKENKKINAFLELNEAALQQAKAIEGKKDKGKLYGLAIGVKANICVQGLTASCASRTLKAYRSPYDADVIKRIKEEDGIIIGVLNCDEFACGVSGQTSAFGPTLNPVAPDHVILLLVLIQEVLLETQRRIAKLSESSQHTEGYRDMVSLT